MSVPAIPAGHRSVTPYLIVDDPTGLLAFLEKAFAAERITPPVHRSDGTLAHAAVRVGDSVIMLGQSGEGFPSLPAMIHLYVEECDSVYQQAIAAGATSMMEPADQFYGDRSGGVVDPFGITWWIATHIEDLTHEEIVHRMLAQSPA